MKRHKSLITLSRDHHFGLVLARRLISGKSKAPRARWPRIREGQRDLAVEVFQKELSSHFEAEERFVFPLASTYLKGEDGTVDLLLRQHLEIRRLVEELQGCGEETLVSLLPGFGRLLEEHIRVEERVLFQEMQRHVPEPELVECGRQVDEFYRAVSRAAPGTCLT